MLATKLFANFYFSVFSLVRVACHTTKFLAHTLGGIALLLYFFYFPTVFAQTLQKSESNNQAAPSISSDAESIYASARPRLLQVRTLLIDTGQQSTLGSAFLVSADGLAITNYHVVSQFALEPKTYKLEYTSPDGSHGQLSLLMIDVINDLAVVRIDKNDLPYFKFKSEDSNEHSLKGERLYALGNPLDLGFTIVEGTYNGLVDHSYNDRIHFSGAINSGMSGGPAVTTNNLVVGINVAKQIGGELISFLVPARFATNLIEQVKTHKPLALNEVRDEISRQLTEWQTGLYDSLNKQDIPLSNFGPYIASSNNSPWFTCWSYTNSGEVPKPLAIYDTTSCAMRAHLFMVDDVNTGSITYSHTYARTDSLSAFQFASFLDKQYYLLQLGDTKGKYFTRRSCHQAFLSQHDTLKSPLIRVVWCAQAYRDFKDLYDVSLLALTEDNDHEALVSRLSMKGVSYANATAYGRRFLGAISWSK